MAFTPRKYSTYFVLVLLTFILTFICLHITSISSTYRVIHKLEYFDSETEYKYEQPLLASITQNVPLFPTADQAVPLFPSTSKALDPLPSSAQFSAPLSGYKNTSVSQADFIAAASQVVIPKFDPVPIQTMCSEQLPWNNDLVLQCSEAIGGLNNVRQQILTCVRWAMEFRAGIILPTIRPRVETNSSEVVVHEYTKARELGILFNQGEFVKRLREGCPQMHIYEDLKVIQDQPSIKVATIFPPKGATKEQMKNFVSNWMSENPASDDKIRIAYLRRFATQYDICYDGEEFANSFGQIVALQKNEYYLASVVLYELSKRFALEFDPKKAVNPGSFFGVHLRTSADAALEGWMSYEKQATAYEKYARLYDLPAIYVASGNLSSTQLFREAVSPIPVVTKTSLLRGQDLILLKSMSWDQQAQVDYLVLLRASRFIGMSDSNFSYAVAIARRTEGTAEGTCGAWKKGKSEESPEPGLALKDEYSIIIGKQSRYHFGSRSWP